MPRFSHLLTLAVLIGAAGPVMAQDWQTRPADERLDAETLTQTLSGNTLLYFDGATAAYETDGRYAYTYGGGGTWLGHYEVGSDSTACVTFVTGMSRCDLYVMSDDKLVVITEDGLRFPIKQIN